LLTSSVAIVPPEPVRRRIDEVRRRFDRVWADVVLGHVSLMKPLKRLFSPAEIENLRVALGDAPCFTARTALLEALVSSDGLFLALRVEPEEHFLDLHRRIVRVLGADASFISFRPHVTVGSFVSQEALAKAYEEIADLFSEVEFFVDAAYLLVVDTDAKPSPVREVTRFELAKPRY
jgi:2'-5' RNA ligase